MRAEWATFSSHAPYRRLTPPTQSHQDGWKRQAGESAAERTPSAFAWSATGSRAAPATARSIIIARSNESGRASSTADTSRPRPGARSRLTTVTLEVITAGACGRRRGLKLCRPPPGHPHVGGSLSGGVIPGDQMYIPLDGAPAAATMARVRWARVGGMRRGESGPCGDSCCEADRRSGVPGDVATSRVCGAP